jgi:superfamily II DNA or RNA helicase
MVYEKLDDYQKAGVDHALKVQTAALYMEQGTGKTWVAAGIIERLHSPRTLIVVPLTNLESTWVKILSEQLPGLPIARSLDEYPGLGVLLLHYEAIPKIIKQLRKHDWMLIIYDESQRLANRGTLQSRTAAKLRHSSEYKVILTGTPIESDPQDLWAQFRFLNDEVLPQRWEDFEEYYFEPLKPIRGLATAPKGSMRWKMLMQRLMIAKRNRRFDMTKLDEFMTLVSPYIYEVAIDDVMDLPLEVHRVPVNMWGEQRRLYEELEKRLILQLQKSSVTALLKVTQLIKLQQITGGFVIDDTGDTVPVGKAKLRMIRRLVKEQTGPFTIFARFIAEVDAIEKELQEMGLSVAVMTGKTKKKQRPIIQSKFQNGEIDAIISQVRVGGVGIDLFKSSCLILYSMGHSSIDYRQIVSRLRRRGQKELVKVFILECFETVDKEFYEAVKNKRRIIDQVSKKLRSMKE